VAIFCQPIKDIRGKGNVSTAVFVDFQSAYDLVWKENLLLKSSKIGLRSEIFN
jgi:hypothetical protein